MTWVNHRRNLPTRTLSSNGVHCTKEADQRKPELGRPEEHSFEVGCFSIPKSVLCPVAKFVVAFLFLVKLHLGSEVYIIQVCLSMPFVFFYVIKVKLIGSELGCDR